MQLTNFEKLLNDEFAFEMQLTNFEKLLNDEFAKRKRSSKSAPEKDPLIRQFREAVWVFLL